MSRLFGVGALAALALACPARGEPVTADVLLGLEAFGEVRIDPRVLKDTSGSEFSEPRPLPPATALDEASEYFDNWQEDASRRQELAEFALSRGFNSEAAFELHRVAETLYQGLLLVLTLYSPKSHNLIRLRNMTEPLEPRLRAVWPHETKFQKRCFELLRAAYVKARYSRHYRITEEELAWLTERIELLRQIVREACEARLAELRRAAGA